MLNLLPMWEDSSRKTKHAQGLQQNGVVYEHSDAIKLILMNNPPLIASESS